MPIGLMDFPILSMQQASPLAAAVSQYSAIQNALKAHQQAKQAQIETGVFPTMLQTGMMNELSPLISSFIKDPKVAALYAPETKDVLGRLQEIASGTPGGALTKNVTSIPEAFQQAKGVIQNAPTWIDHVKSFLSNATKTTPVKTKVINGVTYVNDGIGWKPQ